MVGASDGITSVVGSAGSVGSVVGSAVGGVVIVVVGGTTATIVVTSVVNDIITLGSANRSNSTIQFRSEEEPGETSLM